MCGSASSRSSLRPRREGWCIESYHHERVEPSLLKFAIGAQSSGDALLLHDQERRAVREAPRLVGPAAITIERLAERDARHRNDFRVRIGANPIDQITCRF